MFLSTFSLIGLIWSWSGFEFSQSLYLINEKSTSNFKVSNSDLHLKTYRFWWRKFFTCFADDFCYKTLFIRNFLPEISVKLSQPFFYNFYTCCLLFWFSFLFFCLIPISIFNVQCFCTFLNKFIHVRLVPLCTLPHDRLKPIKSAQKIYSNFSFTKSLYITLESMCTSATSINFCCICTGQSQN